MKHVFCIPKHICLPEDSVHEEDVPYDQFEIEEAIKQMEDKIKGVNANYPLSSAILHQCICLLSVAIDQRKVRQGEEENRRYDQSSQCSRILIIV